MFTEMKGLAYFLPSERIQAKVSDCQKFSVCVSARVCERKSGFFVPPYFLGTSSNACVCNPGLCHWHNKEKMWTGNMYYSLNLLLFFSLMNSTFNIIIFTDVSQPVPTSLFLNPHLKTQFQSSMLNISSVQYISVNFQNFLQIHHIPLIWLFILFELHRREILRATVVIRYVAITH